MEYRELGTTGIRLPVIVFSAWDIGNWGAGSTERSDALDALHTAYDLGITAIDTAPCYGLGKSEELVAAAIKGHPRDRVQLLTKCGLVWEGTKGQPYGNHSDYHGRVTEFYKYAGKASIMKECEDSLRRLETDYIDLYSIHWPDETTPLEESMEALDRLMEQGKIRAAGLCNHPAAAMREAEEVICMASDKVRYSMLNRSIEKELIPYCLEKKKSVLAYNVLQRGILTGLDMQKFLFRKEANLREPALYAPANMLRIRAFLDSLRPLALDKGATLTQLCIRWAIDRPGITTVLLGATRPQQVLDDAKALAISLGKEQLDIIDALLTDLEAQLEWNKAEQAANS